MKKATLGLALVAGFTVISCNENTQYKEKAEQFEQAEKMEQAHLENFDDLDFRVYSGQKWDEVHKSHSQDITVYWPDGRVTKGLNVHIQDMKNQFMWAPDLSIKEHPIKIAKGEWTAVTGVMEGTFSQPMAIANGESIQPTGKKFKISMVTIGRWEDSVMVEEWLYWDNEDFKKQIGLQQ